MYMDVRALEPQPGEVALGYLMNLAMVGACHQCRRVCLDTGVSDD